MDRATGDRIPGGRRPDLSDVRQALVHKLISPAEYTAALVEIGPSVDEAVAVTAMVDLIESGVIADTSDTVATLLGRPPWTVEGYVVRAAAAGASRR